MSYKKFYLNVQETDHGSSDREECHEEMQTSIRSASNIYTPTITSALSIPLEEGMEDELQVKVEALRDGITNLINSIPCSKMS